MSDNVYEGRNAEILKSIINDTEYTDPPQSRIEELLLELKEVIEQGGGGGGTVTLSQLIQQITGYPLNDYGSMSLYSKDLNTITKSGFYNAMTCINAPFDYMTLTVIGYYLEGYTVQIACDVTTGDIKKRNNINGTWSAWKDLGGAVNYSTDEVKIGKLNDEDLYQKVFTPSELPALETTGTNRSINLGLTGIKEIMVCSESICSNNMPFPYLHPNGINLIGYFWDMNSGSPILEVRTGGDSSSITIQRLTVRYTKSTS